jgi:hypothetical protein
MNLVEVLVAGSIVLGSATGSLGIWARTAHSSHDAGQLLAEQRAADAQLLAVQARLQALAAERRGYLDDKAAREADGDLEAEAEPAPDDCPEVSVPEGSGGPGDAGTLTLEHDPDHHTLTATVTAGEHHSRTRVFHLAAYGLCTGAP